MHTDEPDHPLILTIDTTSNRLSLALARGPELRGEWGVITSVGGASLILSDIEFLLKRTGTTMMDLTAFGVLTGPGSFTGLRTGLATVKGLAQALGRPVVTATTLEIAAAAISRFFPTIRICALQKAHREEIFAQLFEREGTALPSPLSPPWTGHRTIVWSEILDMLNNLPRSSSPLMFTGDALDTMMPFLEVHAASNAPTLTHSAEPLHAGWTPSPGWMTVPSPAFFAPVAALTLFEKWRAGQRTSPELIEACYVRLSDAEVKLTTINSVPS